MIYVGIDPSFSRTGVAFIVEKEGATEVICSVVPKVEATDKTFQAMFHRVEEYTEKVLKEVLKFGRPEYIISEEPIPSSSFSAGLYALDTMLFHKLIAGDLADKFLGKGKLIRFYNTNPKYLRFIHKKAYKKTDSVKLAMSIIDLLTENGIVLGEEMYYKNGNVKKIPHDACEALIFLTRLLIATGYRLPSGNLLKEIIYQVEPRFQAEREKVLFPLSYM